MKQFFGKWKKDKRTGELVWKWKKRKVKPIKGDK